MGQTKLQIAANRALDAGDMRYCQSCCLTQKASGGTKIVSSKGRVYGWRCVYCTAKRKESTNNLKKV